jgi:glycosyltransferase involved in cell wall biosynthesis
MNIGIDLRSLGEGSIHRGIGTYVYNLLHGLSKIDKENTYYLFADVSQADYFLINLPHTSNFNYVFVKGPSFRKKKFIRTFVVANYTLDIRKYNLDVIYKLDPLFPIKSGNTPVVSIVYDLIPMIYKDQYMKLTLHNKSYVGVIMYLKDIARHRHMTKMVYDHKKSNKVISISVCTKRDVVKYLGVKPNNVKPILLGADKLESSSIKSKNNGLDKYSKKPFYLYVGGSDPRKGLINLLDDFETVAAKHDVNLVIAGKEITDPRVQASVKIKDKIKKLGLEKRVILPGFVSDEDLSMLYANAIAFVFPSRYEGFGLPILEAMLAKCPVIAYDNSSIPEVAGDAALLVKDGKPMHEYMEKLLLDNTLRKKLIKLGDARSKTFTWEKTAK